MAMSALIDQANATRSLDDGRVRFPPAGTTITPPAQAGAMLK
jgi:hypothetical protein